MRRLTWPKQGNYSNAADTWNSVLLGVLGVCTWFDSWPSRDTVRVTGSLLLLSGRCVVERMAQQSVFKRCVAPSCSVGELQRNSGDVPRVHIKNSWPSAVRTVIGYHTHNEKQYIQIKHVSLISLSVRCVFLFCFLSIYFIYRAHSL